MLRILTSARLLAPLGEDGGEGGGGGGGGDAPAALPSFDGAMQNVAAEADAQLAAAGQLPDGAGPTDPSAPTTQVDPAGGAPAPAPEYLSMEQGRQIMGLWQQQGQQMALLQAELQRLRQPAQTVAPKPTLERPSTLKLMDTWREPQRQQGEAPEDYERRRTGMLLDHFNNGALDYAEKRAEALVNERFEREAQQRAAEQQHAEGLRRYNVTLDDAVGKAGFAAGTPVAQYARDVAHSRIIARVNAGERFNDASLTKAMTDELARVKQFIAAPAAAPAPAAAAPLKPGEKPRAPNGQFTTQAPAPAPAARSAPPISGAHGGAPTVPPSSQPAKARSFEEAMQLSHSRAQRELGEA